MMLVRISISILLFSMCYNSIINAQEVVSPAGATYNNPSSGSISWTIGEPLTETYSNEDMIVTQGFHQGSVTVTGLDINDRVKFDLNIFPNPTADYIRIESGETGNILYSLRLYTTDASLIYQSVMTEKSQRIDLTPILPGEYFLEITDADHHINTFKIIKH
jgi:hypothetical protein